MRLIDAAGIIFSHNDIIALWEKEDEGHDVLIWYGMAWNIPKEYQNIDRWQIFGAIQDKITESDRINIAINDAVTLLLAADAEPVRHGKWERTDVTEESGWALYRCSCCDWHTTYYYSFSASPTYNFCPNCGAKMDGD